MQQQQPSIDQLHEPTASNSNSATTKSAATTTTTTTSTTNNFHQQLQATTAATMQRLRTTFTRSRTPTGAEMKMQNSLEVPKQVRSASFDEMQLESQRASSSLLKQQSSSSASADERSSEAGFLQVPLAAHQQRSHSFDSATASGGSDDSGTFLEVPRRLRTARRSSSTKTPPPCIHCLYLEEYERLMTDEQRYFIDHRELSALSYSNTSSEASEDEEAGDGHHHGDGEEEGSTAIEDAEEETTEAATEEADEDPRTEVESEHDHDPDDDAALEMDIRIGNMSQGSSIEESRARLPRQMRRHTIGSSSVTSASEDEGLEGSDNGSPHFGNTLLPPQPATPCGITFTLSPTNGDYPSPPHLPLDPGSPPMSPCSSVSVSVSASGRLPVLGPTIATPCSAADAEDAGAAMGGLPVRARRRSISRQEAIFVEPTGNSLENVSHEEVDNSNTNTNTNTKSSVDTADSLDEASTMATCGSPGAVGGAGASSSGSHHNAFVVRDIYLMVPDLKRDRAASVDSCFTKLSSNAKSEELQPSADGCFLTVPNINATRSRSVDIVLPTDEQARYKALSMTGSTVTYAD
ncbi:hypothetical protein M5D96_011054, partial [Drosophila gunungcola]